MIESKNNLEKSKNENLKEKYSNNKKIGIILLPKVSKKKEEKFVVHNEFNLKKYCKIKFRKIYFILNIIQFFISTFLFFVECKERKLLVKSSEVIVKIEGEGNIKIFSDYFFEIYNHFEIYLNDSLIDINKNELYFDLNNY